MTLTKLARWLGGTVFVAALGGTAPAGAATTEPTNPFHGATTDAPVPASEENTNPSPSGRTDAPVAAPAPAAQVSPQSAATNAPVLPLAAARPADEKAATPFVGYRGLILGQDLASAALFLIGDSIEGSSNGVGDVMMTTGLIGFALAGPITHFAHHNPERGALSLALRLALPLAGAYIGRQTATCNGGEFLCGLDEFAKGFFIGAGVASLTDVLLIAPYPPSEGVRVPPAAGSAAPAHATPTTAPVPSRTVAFAPSLLVLPDRAMVGLGGSF